MVNRPSFILLMWKVFFYIFERKKNNKDRNAICIVEIFFFQNAKQSEVIYFTLGFRNKRFKLFFFY